MVDNSKLIEKVGEITIGDGASGDNFDNGGRLNNKQQTRFLELIRSYGNLLGRARFVRMTQSNQDIDKMHLGEPVTRAAVEASAQVSVDGSGTDYVAFPDYPWKARPKFNKITLSAVKVRSDWGLSTESLQDNISGNNLEASVMGAIAQRMAHDMEEMAINGDTATDVTATNVVDQPLEHLRDILDGWDKLSDASIILDVNGSYVSKSVFNDMLRIQAKEHRSDPGKVFVCSDNVAHDWLEMLTERATGLGDDVLRSGEGIAPMGVPLIRNSIFRDDRAITTTNPNEELVSGNFGPFTFAAGDVLAIIVDNTDTVTYTFTNAAGVHDANDVVSLLTPVAGWGSTTTGNSKTASDGGYTTIGGTMNANFRAAEIGDGRIVLYSVGASSQITIDHSACTNDPHKELGFLANASTTDADTGGSVTTQYQGSNIWLVNPRNLIWGVLDGTRIYTEYNKDADVIESVIFNQVAAQIEDARNMVKAINVRGKTGWPV